MTDGTLTAAQIIDTVTTECRKIDRLDLVALLGLLGADAVDTRLERTIEVLEVLVADATPLNPENYIVPHRYIVHSSSYDAARDLLAEFSTRETP